MKNDSSANEAAAPTGLESSIQTKSVAPTRRWLGLLLGWGGVALAVLTALLVVSRAERNPLSNVATLQAPVIGVASRVGGPVKELMVTDNMEVAAGQPLFLIDPAPFALAVEVTRANVLAIEGDLVNARHQIKAQAAQVAASEALLAQARTRLAETTETYERLAPLLEKRFVTPEQVDTARRAMESAASGVLAAEAEAEATRLAVAEIAPLEARLQEARALLAQAELALNDCTVRAPFDGLIAGNNLARGFFVQPGVSVFMLVDSSGWYVNADFPETTLKRFAPGQKASVELMTAPGQTFTGVVESVGVAVTDFPELPLGQIPFIRRELDWVRLTQRFPVRIKLDAADFPSGVLRVGTTATVTVHANEEP